MEQTLGVELQIAPSIGVAAGDPLTPSARLILGKRLSNRAYITFARPLGSATRDQMLVLEYDENERVGLGPDADRRPHVLGRLPRAASKVMRRVLFLALVARARVRRRVRPDAAGGCHGIHRETASSKSACCPKAARSRIRAATALIETQVGEPLSMAAVRASITHMFDLGRFQDVRVDATDVPGGVRLRYDLIPLHSVQQVNFRPVVSADGAPARPAKSLGLDEGLLRRTMTNRFGASPAVGRAPDVARTLEQLYRDHGFLRATVRPVAVERHDPDRTLLTFDIDPGPRAVVGAVRVEGSPAGKRDAFVKTIGAVSGKPYQPLALTDGTLEYVEKLHKSGRYEAAASYRSRPSEDATTVDLTIFVQIGRAVTIAYRGDSIPREKLADLVPLAREGSVEEDRVEDAVQRIKRYLNQQGYWKADASAAREEGDGTLTIVFTIRKGAHYVISQGAEIDGNRVGADRAAAASAGEAPAERCLCGIQPERRSQCDRGGLSTSWVRAGQGQRERKRAQSARARAGARPAGDYRHRRAAHPRR